MHVILLLDKWPFRFDVVRRTWYFSRVAQKNHFYQDCEALIIIGICHTQSGEMQLLTDKIDNFEYLIRPGGFRIYSPTTNAMERKQLAKFLAELITILVSVMTTADWSRPLQESR